MRCQYYVTILLILVFGLTAPLHQLAAAPVLEPITETARPPVTIIGAEGYQADAEELILKVLLRRDIPLSDGIISYFQDGDLLVPLQELMLLLEFPIVETPIGADGWFLQEQNTFKLNLNIKTVIIKGVSYPLDPKTARRIDGDLCVSVHKLSSWFPLDFIVNLRTMALHIHPRESVPLEQRRERADKGFGAIYTFRSMLPHADSSYAAVAVPATELDL